VQVFPGDLKFHYLAAVYDGSQIFSFFDGQSSAPKSAAESLDVNSRVLLIGSARSSGAKLAGTVDEVAVYKRALPAAELMRHYDVGRAHLK
jgi:hypothetical protein